MWRSRRNKENWKEVKEGNERKIGMKKKKEKIDKEMRKRKRKRKSKEKDEKGEGECREKRRKRRGIKGWEKEKVRDYIERNRRISRE